MYPGINPREMAAMLKRFGIKNEEIKAKRVIIEKEDGNIVIENPSVLAIDMQGQKSFQISGNVSEKDVKQEIEEKEEDILLIVRQTGKSMEEAKKALEDADGDIAKAILNLKEAQS